MLMLASQPAGSAPAGSILSALNTRPPEAVERDTFDPTEAQCWLTRGRSIEHASELARIWRAFPDLPATAPLDDRMARGREHIAAIKPLNDAISAAVEAERQARNFGLMEQHLADGTIADRDLAILRGRDDHGYDWDIAVAYASGWTAAHAGWVHHFFADGTGRTEAKPKGPRLDETRLPFSALIRLIQTHQDPLVVERLRLERARREAIGETP